VRQLLQGAMPSHQSGAGIEPSVRYEANCEAAATDRLWPDSCR
jgi:hypothetical protein